jgi:hypothetical protein
MIRFVETVIDTSVQNLAHKESINKKGAVRPFPGSVCVTIMQYPSRLNSGTTYKRDSSTSWGRFAESTDESMEEVLSIGYGTIVHKDTALIAS